MHCNSRNHQHLLHVFQLIFFLSPCCSCGSTETPDNRSWLFVHIKTQILACQQDLHFPLQTDSVLVDIATGPVSQERLSAGQQPQTSIMLDGIKIEDHPLRSGQATLGVMLGEFPRAVGK